ncbi:NAD-dependent epimerase/dehydratase family protein [Ramlibacter monticola]|nr:NAD-dependent epimerase/dehydratase family protein [Ramlibacter monticola]
MTPSVFPPCRLVITGASGFVGRSLVARANAAGHSLVALSRSEGSLPRGYEDEAALERACAGADAVLHLAARAHRGGTDADFECNVRATRAVAAAARAAGVRRVVLLSSIGVNGNVTRGRPFDETDAPAPVEPYARSKLRCEQELQSLLAGSATEWVLARPPLVYGPHAPGNFDRLVRAVARGLPLPVATVRNRRTLVGLDNLCDALLLCATHPGAARQLFLLADHEDVSTPDIVRCIARGLARPPRLWGAPPGLLKLAARAAGRPRVAESLCDSLQVDAAKARRVLGWVPAERTPDGLVRAAAAWRLA